MVLPDLILNHPTMSPTFPMCAEQFVSLLNLSAQLHPTLREVCFIQELWELVGRGGGGAAVTIFYCSGVSPLGSAPTHTPLGTIPLLINHCLLLTPEGSRVVWHIHKRCPTVPPEGGGGMWDCGVLYAIWPGFHLLLVIAGWHAPTGCTHGTSLFGTIVREPTSGSTWSCSRSFAGFVTCGICVHCKWQTLWRPEATECLCLRLPSPLPQCSGRLLTTLWEALEHYDTLGEAGSAMVSGRFTCFQWKCLLMFWLNILVVIKVKGKVI